MSREVRFLIIMGIAWAVCLAALAAFHCAVVTPQAQALAAGRTQAAAKAERFSLLRDAKSARGQERLKERQEEVERRYSDFVFTSEQMNELDFRIRAVAEKNGIQEFSARHIGTVSKIGNTELKRVAQRDLVLSMTCGFPEFLHFINELERNQPIVLVDQFTLQNTAGKQAGLNCSLDCSILYQTAAK